MIPPIKEGDAVLRLPLVDKHVYLGVVISYRSYSYQTIKHRVASAQKLFMQLRPWWSRNRLTLPQKLLLWKSCVWSSLSYGLAIVGLDNRSQHLLCTTVMKHLRWLACSPLGEHCESNATLLRRLNLWHPIEHLQQRAAAHWLTRWCLCTSAACHPTDVLQDAWNRLKTITEQTTSFGLWHKKALMSQLRQRHEGLPDLLDFLGVCQRDRVAYMASTEDHLQETRPSEISVDEYVTCPHCAEKFPTMCGLRHHIGRKHGQEFVIRAEPVAKSPEYIRSLGQDGMPLCRRCGKRYVRWDEFTRHVLEDGCHPMAGYVDAPVSLVHDKSILDGLSSN